MARIYALRVDDGRMTIEEVPARWRNEVKQLLKEAK